MPRNAENADEDLEDPSVNLLLSPLNPNSAVVIMENDKHGRSGKTVGVELDLRLHDAVCDPDNMEEIENLVEEEPELVYSRDKEMRTALHILAIDADEMAPQIAKLLLDVIESDASGCLVSIRRKDLLNLQDIESLTALHYAVRNRHVELVKGLLKWGAELSVQDKKGNTPLHLLAAEGTMKSAIECGKVLLRNDLKKDLINKVNNEDKTALHKAVDSISKEFVEFLLQPENGYDISLRRKDNGENILHYTCSATEESEDSSSILKTIVRRCSHTDLNATDNAQRTALHWAAIQRLPLMIKILAAEDATDVTKVDKASKTALHYACQNGSYPRGHECVDVLLSRPVQVKFDLITYLFQIQDSTGFTAFEYACLNCPPSIVLKYIVLVPRPQFWLTATNLTLLFKECPLALIGLMDKSISEDTKRKYESDDDILVDFGAITGYMDPVDNPSPQQEAKYLKEGLDWEYETQKEVLLHPLIQLFILNKWGKLSWIIGIWVLWQLIWLVAFTTLVIEFYTTSATSGSGNNIPAICASIVMLLYIVTSTVNETFELCKVKFAYFANISNFAQIARNICAFISVYPVLTGAESPGILWQKYAAATGILLSYILSMRDIGKLHNKIGLVVEVLKQVLIQILQVLLYCSPLWVGFTLAFVVIFDDEESLNSSFPGPLVKVLVMMTGEFEYKDTFIENENKNTTSMHSSYTIVRFLFFLAFLISVPVAFFNLLTGFALDKVLELRERAKVGRIAEQLEHIYFIESILLTFRPLLELIFPKETVISWFRKFNVTTAWLDQKFTFFTIHREKMRKTERKLKMKKKGQQCRNWFSSNHFSLGGKRKLLREVEDKIYTLASANSINK